MFPEIDGPLGLRPDRKTLSRRLLELHLARALERPSLPTSPPLVLDLGGVARYRRLVPEGRLLTLDLDRHHGPMVVARAESIPFPASTFDLVVSTEMLEHCPEPAKVAAEVHRILKPGGRLVLTTPFIYAVHGWPNDYYRYTASALEHLFASFDRIEVVSFGNRFVVIWDLLVGFAPFLSSWVNSLLEPLVRGAVSTTCPAGHVLVATKR
jgi:SAM-dependent methyltransferase